MAGLSRSYTFAQAFTVLTKIRLLTLTLPKSLFFLVVLDTLYDFVDFYLYLICLIVILHNLSVIFQHKATVWCLVNNCLVNLTKQQFDFVGRLTKKRLPDDFL